MLSVVGNRPLVLAEWNWATARLGKNGRPSETTNAQKLVIFRNRKWLVTLSVVGNRPLVFDGWCWTTAWHGDEWPAVRNQKHGNWLFLETGNGWQLKIVPESNKTGTPVSAVPPQGNDPALGPPI